MEHEAKIHIGTSGYSYDHWKNILYPEKLDKSMWLSRYAEFFDTVELNVTFYTLPSEKSFSHWYELTPDNFSFALKGPRYITHYHKLEPKSLNLFFERVDLLKNKAQVILWQLPPKWPVDLQRFEKFCRSINKYKIRHAFEFRNETWFNDEVYSILKEINGAIVFADWPFIVTDSNNNIGSNKTIFKVPLTGDFIYLRRHGSSSLYSSSYSNTDLKRDVEFIKSQDTDKHIFTYFNNDAEGFAVNNALELKKLLGLNH